MRLSDLRKILTLETRQIWRTLGIYSLVGVVAGLAGVLFTELVHVTGTHVLLAFTGIDPTQSGFDATPARVGLPGANWYWLLLVPTGGALLSGWLCATFAPEAMGTGTDNVINAYHRSGANVRRRVPLVKAVASALTIGSGGSAGVEGPVGFMSAAVGSLIGRFLKLSPAERRVMLMAGFAAGIGAVFHAPMATSIFATEVLYRQLDMEHEVLLPAVIASTLAYATYGALLGWEKLWVLPPMSFDGIVELLPYLVLALALALGGRMFVRLYQTVKKHVKRSSRIPLWLRPAIGGLGIGVVALFVPQALGVGYGMAQTAIGLQAGILTLVVLALAKMVTSALTAGSGGSGGLFAPSLVIGAVIGGVVASATRQLAPALDIEPASFAVVGMAGFFSSVVNAPLSTVIMVSELAGSYDLLVPTLWVCGIAWALGPKVGIYTEQISTRLEAPGHLADMMDAVLRRITVRDALDEGKPEPVTVPPDMPLRELVDVFAHTLQGVFPIVAPDSGRLLGVVDGRELRRTVGEEGFDQVFIAGDFRADALTIAPDASLHEAVSRMSATGYDEIVVVERDGADLVGILSRREIITAYHRRMLHLSGRPGTAGPPAEPSEPEVRPDDLFAALERGDILYDVEGRDHDSVLAEMIRRLDLPEACDRDELLRLLLARERLGSTHIGERVALPHPNTEQLPGLDEPRLVVGFLRHEVPWGYDDGSPQVETVCMLLTPSGPVHLALVGALARSLVDPVLRRLLHDRAPRKRIMDRFRELLCRRSATAPEDE
ncbi:MAG: chloride channel protein [Myxococcota bacterium]